MEIDPVYCDVICKRWKDFTGKKPILEQNKGEQPEERKMTRLAQRLSQAG
jgi:DNA modification methylase